MYRFTSLTLEQELQDNTDSIIPYFGLNIGNLHTIIYIFFFKAYTRNKRQNNYGLSIKIKMSDLVSKIIFRLELQNDFFGLFCFDQKHKSD